MDPCESAEQYISNNEFKPKSDLMPAKSPHWYIPMSRIDALFGEGPDGMKLEALFLCPCKRCTRDGGPLHERSAHFNEHVEEEIRKEYAAIYALLIYIHRPALIRTFIRHDLKLLSTRYLQEEDFARLSSSKENIAELGSLKTRILREQYSFQVRTLTPFSDIKEIPAKELLPIEEDSIPKGQGSFAEVRCFNFQLEEYRSPSFGQITKFARKIFRDGLARASAKEWYNLQCLFKSVDHQHLMPALGAYWHGDIFFILQEAADFSLHDYLKGQGTVFEPEELWKQVRGLAEGLHTLHQLQQGTRIAYHQDLKPANILIVRGTLKIADFGLLEFRPVLPEDTDMTGVESSHITGSYAPPRNGRYTREDDIWSLACIISELATVDIQGREEMAVYRIARTVNKSGGHDTPAFFSGRDVKSQVLEKHKSLQRIVQMQDSPGANSFRKGFYRTEFFTLLNSLFRHKDGNQNLPGVPGRIVVPDAGQTAQTLNVLRKEALPVVSFDNQAELPVSLPRLPERDSGDLLRSLDRTLSDFKSGLMLKDKRAFGSASGNSVNQFIVNLQAKQCSEGRQQGLKRLKLFLDAYHLFEQILGKYCNAKNFMAFVWGPIKHVLEITDGYPEAFSQIVSLFGKIGTKQLLCAHYEELLHSQTNIADILGAGYSDIIYVHRQLLEVFSQRCWKDIYSTTWPRIMPQLMACIAKMASRLELIEHGGADPQRDIVSDLSTLQVGNSLIEADDEALRRRQILHTWLRPIDMETEQFHYRETWSKYSAGLKPGKWLLDHITFKEWFDPRYTAPPTLLWLHGDPGVGKSILASIVIDEARSLRPQPIVLFFYFKQEDTEQKKSVVTFFRKLIEDQGQDADRLRCLFVGRKDSARKDFKGLAQIAVNSENNEGDINAFGQCRSRELGELLNIPSAELERISNLVAAFADGKKD
ncbi:hypothetical protein FKW77_007459 [Venturia effusa]|uniref:Protein kinase domain-containing protein n=1 Tax=Venturia effusa TaxID=50376 RepID=A0A517LCL4_9PEZI|nr:hypothetical protein FKW77_007459 [Venturia effusa]